MLRIVEWRGVFRILDDENFIVAVCETRAEAEAYLDNFQETSGSAGRA